LGQEVLAVLLAEVYKALMVQILYLALLLLLVVEVVDTLLLPEQLTVVQGDRVEAQVL
jgi:hypothetical protein